MIKNLFRLFIASFLLLSIFFAYLTLFPLYTIVVRMEVTVWAYSVQAKRAGAGYIEEPCPMRRYMSLFNSFYPVETDWNISRKYEIQDQYEVQTAEFILLVRLVSDTFSRNWSSPILTINRPESHIAMIYVVLSNIKQGKYFLEITLLQRNETIDSIIEYFVIP